MASLTFGRQIGGSLGIAIFGWIILFLAGTAGLITVFAVAAAALAAAFIAAPTSAHDTSPAREGETASAR
jgi:hypothetical protein